MKKYIKPAIEMMAMTEEELMLAGSTPEGFEEVLDDKTVIDPAEMLIRGENPLQLGIEF